MFIDSNWHKYLATLTYPGNPQMCVPRDLHGWLGAMEVLDLTYMNRQFQCHQLPPL